MNEYTRINIAILILYGIKREEFGTLDNLFLAILFLTIIPICSYPIAIKKNSQRENRNNQRKMAFVFNFISYLAAMLIGYLAGCSKMLQWIFNAYFLAVMILTIINKGFKIRASGHACSCTLPYLILSDCLGWIVAIICMVFYLAEFWSSIELKRHIVKEFLLGSVVACLTFLITVWI